MSLPFGPVVSRTDFPFGATSAVKTWPYRELPFTFGTGGGALGNWLLTGQSWISGRLTNNQTYTPAGAGARLFGNDYVLKTLVDPTDDGTVQIDGVSGDVAGGSVWPLVASRMLVANGSKPHIYIPCAKGGTTILQWQAGADHQDRTTLYGSAVYRGLQVGSLAANLCIIGVSDAIAGTTQADFRTRFSAFAADIKADLGIKTVLGKYPFPTDAAGAAASPTIYAAIDELWASDPNVIRGPDLSGVISDDSFHFTTDLKGSWEADQWIPIMQSILRQSQSIPASTNLVPSSDSFNLWTALRVVVTADAASFDPVSGAFADRIAPQVSGSGVQAVVSPAFAAVSGEVWAFRFYAKAETPVQFIQMYGSGTGFGVDFWANFDLVNGVIGSRGTGTDAFIRSVGSGWYECQMRRAMASTNAATQMVINVIGTSTSLRSATDSPTSGGVLLARAQGNKRQSAAPYI